MPCWLPVLLVAPSLIWLARDRSVWPWDQAWYAAGSVELFHALIHTPAQWLREMRAVVEAQSPGVVWLGQAFVPLGLALGSVEDGLLVSILATHAAALGLVHRALMELSGGRHANAAAGCLMAASAPLFVGLSHQYFAEPLQLLAVSWFVFIMSAAPRWSGPFTLAQLAAAAAVALSAKVSSPAYCAGPGLVALWHALRRQPASPRGWREPRTLVTGLAAILLVAATALWYRRNLAHVLHHVSASVAGPHAEIYGRSEAFLRALAGRSWALVTAFFRPYAGAALAVLSAVALAWRGARRQSSSRFATAAAVAVLQAAAVLTLLALSPNHEARYLLALLPYCALLMAWAFWRANVPALTAAALVALAWQLGASHGVGLGLVPAYVYGSPWLDLPRTQVREAAILDELVSRTCAGTAPRSQRYWNVVGIELPWLNKNSASFAAAKTLGPRGLVGCRYDSVFDFTVTDPDVLWARVREMKARYYVAKKSGLASVPPDDAHLVAVNRNTAAVLDRVRSSGEYEAEPPLAADPDILILRRRYFAQ